MRGFYGEKHIAYIYFLALLERPRKRVLYRDSNPIQPRHDPGFIFQPDFRHRRRRKYSRIKTK